MSAVPAPQATSSTPVPRWEWLTILGVGLVASSLRFSFPSRLAVEHFDEGVYASNIWFGHLQGGVYPHQHLYAPPMLPALIEWLFVFFGPSNPMAMLPSQVAGTATVILMWWLGRSWFGPVAGLTAASLCAMSEVHILLSRSALTDALLGMWWVAALIALRRACDSGRWSHSLLAGYLVAMAWYSKYNGWMPLAITLAAVIARGACCRGIWPQTRTALMSCLIAGATAVAAWSPWLWSLQSKGGYASVMANHRQYIVGLSGWMSSLLRQWQQLSSLTGRLSMLTLLGAFVVLSLLANRYAQTMKLDVGPDSGQDQPNSNPDWRDRFARLLVYFSTSAWLIWALASPVVSCPILTVQALAVWWFLQGPRTAPGPQASRSDLGYWCLLVWFGGLLFATPLYLPYLRLTLPWELATFLGLGLAYQQYWNSLCPGDTGQPEELAFRRSRHRQTFCLIVMCVLVSGMPLLAARLRWALIPAVDQRGFADAGRLIAAKINQAASNGDHAATPTLVYVYAEPALLFQLKTAGLAQVAPIGSLQFTRTQFSRPDQKIYLAFGVHATSDPHFIEQFNVVRGQLKPVGTWPWQLGPLVALDQPSIVPHKLGRNPAEAATIELYEVQTP